MKVLYLSEIQWLSQVSRKHLLVRRFPEDWEVLFLSPINAKGRENSFIERRDPARPTVRFRSLPLPKPDAASAAVRSLTPALALLGRGLVRNIAGWFAPDVVVCSYIWAAPSAEDLAGGGTPVVYDLNDLHPEFYPRRHDEARSMFLRLVDTATEVVASSRSLRDEAGRGVVIGNGVDLDTFSGRRDLPLPAAIAGSPLASSSDLVAYVGSVDDRIDFAILERLLERLRGTGVGLVLVGRVFDAAASRRADLERRFPDDVLFTGRVPYAELPSYLAHASVGIAPFLLNARTRAINPNKLYMYAAMHENIVATPFSREIEEHADLVFLASQPDAFAEAVMAARADEGRRQTVRERIALANSWDGRAAEFAALLTRLAGGAQRRSRRVRGVRAGF